MEEGTYALYWREWRRWPRLIFRVLFRRLEMLRRVYDIVFRYAGRCGYSQIDTSPIKFELKEAFRLRLFLREEKR